MTTPWIKCFHPRSDARTRLVCLPYAGGSASTYRTWGEILPRSVEVWPVQLPGREERFSEPAFANRSKLVAAMADALGPLLTTPFALFGHSMGAALAFELARELRRRGARAPSHLFASARRAPHLPRIRPPLHDLPKEKLIEALREYNGTPEAVLKDPELLDLFLPTIRADFTLNEEPYAADAPLDCPITALGGIADDRVTAASLEAWREHTTGSFWRQMFPGDHFYLVGARRMLLEVIAARATK